MTWKKYIIDAVNIADSILTDNMIIINRSLFFLFFIGSFVLGMAVVTTE